MAIAILQLLIMVAVFFLTSVNRHNIHTYAPDSSILPQIYCHKLVVAGWSTSKEKCPQKETWHRGA
jgi:hypothetical protein